MLPDISGGRLFCKWLRDTYGIDTDALPTYLHVFEDGRRVPAKASPKVCLRIFAGIFEKSGCRTAPSTISGAGTVKLCSTCQS
jgi:LSD1 subclass zinc finger protein